MSESSSPDKKPLYELNTPPPLGEPLSKFNSQLLLKYRKKVEVDHNLFRVLEPDELSRLRQSPSQEMVSIDQEILPLLADIAGQNILTDSDQIEHAQSKIEKYLEESAKLDKTTNISPPAGSLRTQLRRTAALLYKSLRVPQANKQSGQFKTVLGPLRIKPETKDSIVDKIGRPLWQWDGSFTNINLETASSRPIRHQLVKVRPNLESTLQQVRETPEAHPNQEYQRLAAIAQILEYPSYLPHLPKHISENDPVYVEYIPKEFASLNIQELSQALAQIDVAAKELWQKAGIINPDLKPDSIRLRSNNEPVIVDWSFVLQLEPRQKELSGDLEKGMTPIYLDPEIVKSSVDTRAVPTEPYLVHRLCGTGLDRLFTPEETDKAIAHKRGFEWRSVLAQQYQMVSFTSDTFLACWENEPERTFPRDLALILYKGLSESASDRPELDEVIKEFQKVANDPDHDLVTWEEFNRFLLTQSSNQDTI